MSSSLSGKTAFVTGSGRGLGRAIAERLAESGAAVAIHDITPEAPAKYGEAAGLQAVAEDLRRFGVPTHAVAGNLGEPGQALRMAAEIEAALGPVSVLVNCAGGDIGAQGTKPQPNTALEIGIEDVRALINNNFLSAVLACQAFCPGMRQRKEGSVINITSVSGHFGSSPEVIYASMKAAVAHFTRCLAYELRPHGVRVNAVSPGPTKTARFLATRKVDPAMMEEAGTLIRYGTPGEIADAVAFLASDASRFISGQVIRVDGGMTLYPG